MGVSYYVLGVVLVINIVVIVVSWLGVGLVVLVFNVIMFNVMLYGLVGWVDVKLVVVLIVIVVFEIVNVVMCFVFECMENCDEWGVDNVINFSVLWILMF